MEKKLRVKFFGESFVIHKLKIDDELITKFNNVALQLKIPLNEALLDIDFFRVLNIIEYESINDLISLTSVGLINNNKGQIEISLGRKRIAKFNTNELFNITTLFPLYKTRFNSFMISDISSNYHLEEREVGLIGFYEINVENFQIDLLHFHLSNLELINENCQVVHEVTYNGQRLPKTKSDSLLRYQRCFFK
jgi:hypothetical protein